MRAINIHEAKTKLSQLVDMAAKGETFYGRFAPEKQKAA